MVKLKRLADGSQLDGTVVGADPVTDLAVVRNGFFCFVRRREDAKEAA